MNIRITMDLPPDVEQRLQAESSDLAVAVREGFAVELFRRGLLTHFDLGRCWADRFETVALLKRHQVASFRPHMKTLTRTWRASKSFSVWLASREKMRLQARPDGNRTEVTSPSHGLARMVIVKWVRRSSLEIGQNKGCVMSVSILDRPTLVLNRNWQPVNVATVARSLTMLWNESARVVDPDDFRLYTWKDWARLVPRDGEPFIRTVTFRLRVPEVLSLNHYDRARESAVPFCRRNIFKRDHLTCQYCGARPGSEELTIDHIIPRAHGGASTWENCVLACVACNAKKSNRTPEQAHMRLRKQPHRPSWKPLYAASGIRIESWSKFLSEAYWNVTLE